MPAHSIPARWIQRCSRVLLGLVLAGPAAGTADFLYRVEPGDTVIGVSQRRLADPSLWRKVARYNRLPDPDFIRPGQELRIPLAWLMVVPTSA
jgi:hypothetical protein